MMRALIQEIIERQNVHNSRDVADRTTPFQDIFPLHNEEEFVPCGTHSPSGRRDTRHERRGSEQENFTLCLPDRNQEGFTKI